MLKVLRNRFLQDKIDKTASYLAGDRGHIGALLIIIVFGLYGLNDLFHPGLYSAHDIWHQVARLYHYFEATKAGLFPPNWVAPIAEGTGYPLFYFSYHLPWLIALPFLLVGVSIPTAIKLVFLVAYLTSGLGMYLFVHQVTRNKMAALGAAVAYLWVPYQFFAALVAGAIGTSLCLALLPFLFLGLWLIIEKQATSGILLTAVSAAGLMLSHLIGTVMIAPFTLVFVIILTVGKSKFFNRIIVLIAAAAILALLLSAFYWLPMYELLPDTKGGASGVFASIYQNYFVNLSQLVYSPWGYGPITSSAKNGEISFQVGIIQWIAVTVLLYLQIINKNLKQRGLAFAVIATFGLSFISMLDISQPLWELVKKYLTLDFPFRLLIISAFFGSLAVGLVIAEMKHKYARLAFFVFAVMTAWYTNRNHIRVNMYLNFDTESIVRAEKSTNTYAEYLPKSANAQIMDDESSLVIPEGYLASEPKLDYKGLFFEIDVPTEDEIMIRQFDYPGQTVYINGEIIDHQKTKDGQIVFAVQPGYYQIAVTHQSTISVKIGRFLSLIGVGILLVSVIKHAGKKI